MTNNQSNVNNIKVDSENGEIIELDQIFLTLLNEKKLISIFAFFSVLLSVFFALISKRVWEGEFQIVLRDQNTQITKNINPALTDIIGIQPNSSSLKTEVAILRSPYVLMSIFQDIKKEKISKNQSSFNNLKFKEWRSKSLKIGLDKGTSILNLSYRDNDKNAILSVLNKISTTYQEYSDKQRLKIIQPTINYLEEQLQLYKEKNIKSLKNAQEFAMNNDLTLPSWESDIDIISLTDIETKRIKVSNAIRSIDFQISEIKNFDGDINDIQTLTNALPEKDNELLKKIKSLESGIAFNKTVYKENDKAIFNSIKRKDLLLNLFKKQLIEKLEAKKFLLQSEVKAYERPKGVLMEYSQLLSSAAKDKSIINNLEKEYRLALLSKAKSSPPWELITKPTLLPYPVAPARKRIVLIGFMGGLFLGIFAALISGIKKDLILSPKELKRLTSIPIISEFFINQNKRLEDSVDFFVSNIIREYDKGIAFLTLENSSNVSIEKFKKGLLPLIKDKEFIFTENIIEASEFNNIFIIVEINKTRRKELLDILHKIVIQKKFVNGLLVIN